MNTKQYIKRKIFSLNHKKPITLRLENDWIKNKIKQNPGVYAAYKNEEMWYAGETGNLRGRFLDLKDTRYHNLRVTIGKKEFKGRKGDGFNKFSKDVEEKIDNFLKNKLTFRYIKVDLGRIEIEEELIKRYSLKEKYNHKGKRESD